MKPVVAIDLDDVLFSFVDSLVDWHNRSYGTVFALADFFTFDLCDVWGGTRQEAIDKVNRFFMETPEQPPPLPESVMAIDVLKEHFSLALVTARHDELKTVTLSWIEEYFPETFDSVALCNHYVTDGRSTQRSKAEVCTELDAHVLIDDSLRNVFEVAASGRRALLFGEFPWNQSDTLPTGVIRVSGWRGVVTELLGDAY